MEEPTVKRVVVSQFLAKQIGKHGGVDELELAEAIDEIELETQTLGAPFIKVHLIDPYYRLLTSGFITAVEGLLNSIQVEFPEGSNWWWQLAAVEVSNDLTQPNLTLTFEDRIVSQLREITGYKTVPAGTQTRAEFVKALIDEANLKLRHEGKEPIRAVIPSLEVLQEVEESTSEKTETLTGKNELGQTTLTSKSKRAEKNRVNRAPAIGEGTELKVGGQPIESEQTDQANILLGVANKHKAPLVAVEALIFAGIAETRLRPLATLNSAGLWGILQSSPSNWPKAPQESAGMAESFLLGGKGFQSGGAIALANGGATNPVEIAVRVEAPSEWPTNAYATQPEYQDFLPEAQAIINAGGGAWGGSAGGSTTGSSDVAQLTRGTPADPYESTWDCIERLAQQVRWYAFTSGLSLTTFRRGRFFYYMDAHDQIRQKPAAYLEIPANKVVNAHKGKTTVGAIASGMLGTVDNTAFEYRSTHKVKGKISRKSRIAKPQTPTELRVPLICEPLEYQAGDVFVVRNSGTFNGRWVVTDAVRKYIEGPYTTLTLTPPLAPYPEPAASSSGASTGVQAVVENAEKAYSEKSKYSYSQEANRENNGTLFGEAPRTMDCSSFATLVYKAAGMPDPSGRNYSPIGNTTSMIAHMVETKNPVPGDLGFYGSNPKEPTHVVINLGNGNAIGMENPAVGLAVGPFESLGNPPFIGWYRLKGEYPGESHTTGGK